MEVTREELRRNGILNRGGLLGGVVSGNSAADQAKEIQAGMLSPKTPQQNLALGETYAKPRPFTPDARYYPNVGTDRLDLVPGKTFPSPAQAYMAEVAAARAAEEAKSGPGPTTDPYAALKAGLGAGEGVAQYRSQGNAINGLLGDINWKGLMDKLIQTFQRPEMLTPGVNALTSFGMAGAGLNQDQIAGETAKQARMDKFALEQLKNAPGAPKITAESVKLYDRINTSRANASLVQKMKMALTGSPSTGAIGTGEQALVAMLNALNIPIGTSASKDYDKLVAQLKTGLLRSGRLLKADYELLESRLPKSGTWQNKEELLNSLRDIEDSSNRQLYEDQQILKTFGLPAGSGAQPASMIRSRNK